MLRILPDPVKHIIQPFRFLPGQIAHPDQQEILRFLPWGPLNASIFFRERIFFKDPVPELFYFRNCKTCVCFHAVAP